jgi:hypothetical protein
VRPLVVTARPSSILCQPSPLSLSYVNFHLLFHVCLLRRGFEEEVHGGGGSTSSPRSSSLWFLATMAPSNLLCLGPRSWGGRRLRAAWLPVSWAFTPTYRLISSFPHFLHVLDSLLFNRSSAS